MAYLESGGGSGGVSKSQLFEASGTFTVPANISLIHVTAIGGGGGGSPGGTGPGGFGGGGGAGGYLINKKPISCTPGAVFTVVVGAGGLGSYGGSGGNTTFTLTSSGLLLLKARGSTPEDGYTDVGQDLVYSFKSGSGGTGEYADGESVRHYATFGEGIGGWNGGISPGSGGAGGGASWFGNGGAGGANDSSAGSAPASSKYYGAGGGGGGGVGFGSGYAGGNGIAGMLLVEWVG